MNAVILERPKYPHNVAAALRACSCFGVERLLWTGKRFEFKDGERLPREERMKGYSDVVFKRSDRPFDELLRDDFFPEIAETVCVELRPGSTPLTHFEHPTAAIYVFGPEDGSVSQAYRALCANFVYIPSKHCLNLAAAVNVVLADRVMKQQRHGQLGELSPGGHEARGWEIPTVLGWDGK